MAAAGTLARGRGRSGASWPPVAAVLLLLVALGSSAAPSGTLRAQPAAAPAATVLANSARLGVEIVAPAGASWCGERPEFRVVAPDAGVFAAPEFATLVERLGARLVASRCPQARAIALSGMVRGRVAAPAAAAAAVWRGTAEAASGWSLRAERQGAADLGAAPVPAAPAPSAAAAAAAGPSSSPSAPPPPPIAAQTPPAATASALDAGALAKAEAALRSSFGRFDPRRRCWAVTARDEGGIAGASGCLRIVRAFRVPAAPGGGAQVHVLLTGKGDQDCHPCTGLAAFAVLDAASDPGGAWQVVARPVPLANGIYGNPTDARSFTFARLGAERWGWIEEVGDIHQGFAGTARLVHLQRGPSVVDAGRLPGDRDNLGACAVDGPEKPAGCEHVEDIKVTATVDRSDPSAVAYPFVLRARGTVDRRRIDKQLTVRFDEAQFRYAAPNEWP